MESTTVVSYHPFFIKSRGQAVKPPAMDLIRRSSSFVGGSRVLRRHKHLRSTLAGPARVMNRARRIPNAAGRRQHFPQNIGEVHTFWKCSFRFRLNLFYFVDFYHYLKIAIIFPKMVTDNNV